MIYYTAGIICDAHPHDVALQVSDMRSQQPGSPVHLIARLRSLVAGRGAQTYTDRPQAHGVRYKGLVCVIAYSLA